ncbi:MAG: hypothetical protein IH616_18820 [Gemmatimonadales bacterium]|nr:hypothetical protein [Gemmatimonadales bacterium]
MNEYLACHDYGMGGIWYRMEAVSAQAVRQAFPQFVVFEDEPDWWKDNPRTDLPVHRVGDPLDPVLARICDESSNE